MRSVRNRIRLYLNRWTSPGLEVSHEKGTPDCNDIRSSTLKRVPEHEREHTAYLQDICHDDGGSFNDENQSISQRVLEFQREERAHSLEIDVASHKLRGILVHKSSVSARIHLQYVSCLSLCKLTPHWTFSGVEFFKCASLPICPFARRALQVFISIAAMHTPVDRSQNRMEPPTANWRAKLLDALRTLNLFDSESSDANIIQRERWSTRVYLVLLCLLMLSLTIYSAQVSRTILVTRSQPTEDQFVELHARYPNTLTCPCSRVAIQYREIVRSQVTFHEVCQSKFISQENIDASYGANVTFISPVDIRTTLSAFWQVVRSFCTLSKNTWTDVQIDFDGTLLLSPAAQPPSLVEAKVRSSLQFSLATSLSNLERNLLVTQGIIQANGLVSASATNFHFYLVDPWDDQYSLAIQLEANSFVDGCFCSTGSGCPRPTVVFASNGTVSPTNVPGMMFDCLPVDAAFASSFQCFYDPECLSLIYPPTSRDGKPSPLVNPSRFARNVTLQMLLNELMIEENKTDVLYSSYYAECRPTYCSYSYSRRFHVLFMITLLVSAYGGISAILPLLIPLLIRLVFIVYEWKKRQNTVDTGNDQQSTSHRKSEQHRR